MKKIIYFLLFPVILFAQHRGLDNRVSFGFADTTSMKSFAKAGEGAIAYLEKFSSVSQAATGGFFQLIDSAYVENGVIAFSCPEQGLQWVRQAYLDDGRINVLWAGAIGDSIHNSTMAFRRVCQAVSALPIAAPKDIYIPNGRFIVYAYVYRSFFGFDQKSAIKSASHLSKYNPKRMDVDLNDYDLMNFEQLLKALSDADVTPGLNSYRFLEQMIRSIGAMNLPFFEDIMRFSTIMIASSINGNSYFSPAFQMFNPTLFSKVINIADNTISKAM